MLLRKFPFKNKALKGACIKKSRRKKKDTPTVHVLGQISNLMLSKTLMSKYSDPGSPMVTIHINEIQI